MLTALVIGLAFAMLVIVGAAMSEWIKELGVAEEKLRQKDKQAAIDKKRAEIIAQPRTDDETINSLDDGTF